VTPVRLSKPATKPGQKSQIAKAYLEGTANGLTTHTRVQTLAALACQSGPLVCRRQRKGVCVPVFQDHQDARRTARECNAVRPGFRKHFPVAIA
jgi:hypothetical protein